MQRFSHILLLIISGCSSGAHRDVTGARIIVSQQEAAKILNASKNANIEDSSRWRLEGGNLFFNGNLQKGDCQQFLRKIDREITTLVVNSAGGDAFEGLCIAREMRQRNFSQTIVKGLCVSSCANYLFLGSKHRLIQDGFVGYHGNITALLRKDPNNSSLRKQLTEAKVDPKEIERVVTEFMKAQQANSFLEQKFLSDTGISQDLFERTQNPDKGTGDGKSYTFLLPSPKTFLKYGIENVEGEQNFNMGRSMGLSNLLQ